MRRSHTRDVYNSIQKPKRNNKKEISKTKMCFVLHKIRLTRHVNGTSVRILWYVYTTQTYVYTVGIHITSRKRNYITYYYYYILLVWTGNDDRYARPSIAVLHAAVYIIIYIDNVCPLRRP